MRCGKPANVSSVLIGLHQVGIVGLRDALKNVHQAGLEHPDEIVDALASRLESDNYIPDSQVTAYRRMLFREYLRFRGEDFSAYYSDVAVSIRGPAGEDRDRFVRLLTSVFSDFELTPVIDYEEGSTEDAAPELRLDGEIVVRGCQPRDEFKAAVRRRISDW